jgi:hypothetical protein
VPKPLLQGYAVIKGVLLCATAILSPVDLNDTPRPVLAGSVAGLAYLVPKPLKLAPVAAALTRKGLIRKSDTTTPSHNTKRL